MFSTSFAYTDFAVSRALRTRMLNGVKLNIAYDSACSYSVNVVDRFRKNIGDFVEYISTATFVIDALHIHNHREKCMYLFSANYKEAIGRLAAIGSEQYWSENNQLGPQTRQMNKGHRHDKISEHHSDWNWKKTKHLCKWSPRHYVNSDSSFPRAQTLTRDLVTARELYRKKKHFFRKLCDVHSNQITAWFHMDRTPRVRPNGVVESVYRNRVSGGEMLISI